MFSESSVGEHLLIDGDFRGLPKVAQALMLAAQALRLGAMLVTHNIAEFARVPSLAVEDWQS